MPVFMNFLDIGEAVALLYVLLLSRLSGIWRGMNKPLTCLTLGVAGVVCLFAPRLGGTAGQRQNSIIGSRRPPAVTWAPLAHQPPNSGSQYFTTSETFLMTDGTVLAVAEDVSYNFNTHAYFSDPSVFKLTPDINGSYANGTWTQVASMHHSRLYFGSSVLADGRLLVSGGEYADGSSLSSTNPEVWSNATEIYDPVTNIWTVLPAPTGWSNVGDAPGMVLPNGKFLMGSDFDKRTAIFDPITNTWSAGTDIPAVDQTSDEEAWALLPNNRILAVNCFNHPDSRYYDIGSGSWVGIGNTPVDLVDNSDDELGPSMLMPNGTVFQMGATPFDCIYTPSTNTWANGPAVPIDPTTGAGLCAPDAPAVMEPNGKLLLALTPFVANAQNFGDTTTFVETDGTTMSTVSTPSIASGGPPFVCRFLVLQTGQILFTAQGDGDNSNNTVYIGTPTGSAQASWQPTISTVSGTLQQGSANNVLTGTQLNGISQGSSYGDDSTNFTNYPIVRIQNTATGHVFYCKTHNHSTMGVATGSAIVSTQFDVPVGTETGPSSLYVVANGIPSAPQVVNVVAPHVYLPLTYSLFRGALFSGSLSSLFYTDSNYLEVLTGPTVSTEAPVQYVLTTTSPTLSPTSFKFTLTAKTNTPGVAQTISLFNYSTGLYDVLDTRAINTSTITVTVTASGTLSHYVNASGTVQARVAYAQTGPTTLYRWAAFIDLANWTIQ